MRTPSTARKRRPFELDWVIVSIEGIRRWGLLAFFVVVAGGVIAGLLYFAHEPIDRKAQRVLRQATATREEVRRTGVSEALAGEFEQASRLVQEAQEDWDRKDYPACLARAQDALRRFELLAGFSNPDFAGSGQIIALQGKVEVQRANQAQWERARERQPLYNGDFVKTSSEGSAEILFSDGTVFRVGSDSLLEVHREARGGRVSAQGEVRLKIGEVKVYTTTNPSLVLTDAARAEVENDSRVGVDVASDSSAVVSAYSGRAKVTSAKGEETDLGERQSVRAERSGELKERRAIPDVPLLEQPPANFLLDLDKAKRVTLGWRPVTGAVGYHLQVSRSRLFASTGLEVDAKARPDTRATLNVLRAGTFYWRVAALGDERVRSEWSPSRTFKAFTGARLEELTDTTPPRLEIAPLKQLGNFVLVQGVTEPGATVTVNGEPAEVSGDGTFKKTVVIHQEGRNILTIRSTDPAGNSSERVETVFMEVE